MPYRFITPRWNRARRAARTALRVASFTGLTFAASLSVSACANLDSEGGLNENGHGPGDEPGGVHLQGGNIAVSPSGRYIVFKQGNKLATAFLSSGKVFELPVSNPGRLSFSKTRDVVYVAAAQDGSTRVVAVDVAEQTTLWSTEIPESDDQLIAASPDDSRVAVAVGRHGFVIDTADGSAVGVHSFDTTIVDLDIVPQQATALMMTEHEWQGQTPMAKMVAVDLDDGDARAVDVPNCADKLTVTADGKHALMAPSRCDIDPISVIDISAGAESFLNNLPGFGPVSVSTKSNVAVGFYNTEVPTGAVTWAGEVPTGGPKYHLMIINTDDFSYEFAPYGDHMPRYALTPEGNVLLVDNALADKGRLFDIETKTFKDIDGPIIKFGNFSLTSGSERVYLLTRLDEETQSLSLIDLDIATAKADVINAGFYPQNINIAPDDSALFLRMDSERICVFDLATKTCASEINVTPPEL